MENRAQAVSGHPRGVRRIRGVRRTVPRAPIESEHSAVEVPPLSGYVLLRRSGRSVRRQSLLEPVLVQHFPIDHVDR